MEWLLFFLNKIKINVNGIKCLKEDSNEKVKKI